MVFEAGLRSRSHPNMIVGWQIVEIFGILLSSYGQLYVTVLSLWSDYEPLMALAVPSPSIQAYNSFIMIDDVHGAVDTWDLARCEKSTLVLCAI